MTLADLRRVADLLPPDASLTLSKALLLELLAGADAPATDLTVRELAERLHRAPSTVRGWCEQDRLPGAYKLNGRDWRVPAEAMDSFLADQHSKYATRTYDDTHTSPVDLGAWRREQSVRDAA
jgi:excisionase family DNA binding protein